MADKLHELYDLQLDLLLPGLSGTMKKLSMKAYEVAFDGWVDRLCKAALEELEAVKHG